MENRSGSYRRASSGAALYVTMAVAFLVIAAVAAMGLFFKITTITVNGAGRYTAEEIIRASKIELDSSIFFVDRSGAEVAIKKELPYVDSVRVVRNLPGTVTINVTESVPSAWFALGGANYVMDASGRILERTSFAPQAMELRGVTPIEPEVGKTMDLGNNETVRLTCLNDTMKALADNKMLSDTSWLDLTNLASVTFQYKGYRVNVGNAQDLEVKIGVLLQYLDTQSATSGQISFDDSNQLHFVTP